MYAAEKGHLDVIETLVEGGGYNITIRDNTIRNAVVIDASTDHHPTVRQYLAKQISEGFKVADEGGSLALHLVFRHNGPRQEVPS